MEELLFGIKGVIIYIDGVLIFAGELGELRKSTTEVLRVLDGNNLTLNEGKGDYEVEKTDLTSRRKRCRTYWHCVADLRSFLGLAAYIEGFADISKPLWDATVGVRFECIRQAFDKLKRLIAECTVKQGFFDGNDKPSERCWCSIRKAETTES